MTRWAYYNDSDPFVCAWLRNLIAAGHLVDGEVDERPIEEVTAADVRAFTQCHFFAGIGGWAYGLQLAQWPAGEPVWTGSCPCQPLSAAGKREAADDKRHLWPAWYRLIEECHPPVVFGEQVASKLGRLWLTAVRLDLEALGYAVGAADLCAAGVGAPHIRQRLWFVAESEGVQLTRATQPREHPAEIRRAGQDGGAPTGRSSSPGIVDDSAGPRRDGSGQGAEGEAWDETRLRGPESRCPVGELADTLPAGRTQGRARPGRGSVASSGEPSELGDTQKSGRETRESESIAGAARSVQPNKSSRSGRMAHSDGGQPSDGDLQRGGEHGQQPQDGRTSALADSECGAAERQRHNLAPTASAPQAETREREWLWTNPWASCEFIPCRDGKARPVEPKYVAVVDGLPSNVGSVRPEGQAQAGWPTPNCPSPHDSQHSAGRPRNPRSGYGMQLADVAGLANRPTLNTEALNSYAKTEIDRDGGDSLRDVRENKVQAPRPPQGSEPGEQFAGELTDFVRLLPSSLALAQLHGDTATAEALLAVLKTSGAERLVQHPPHAIEAVWRSLGQEDQDRFGLAVRKGCWMRTHEFPLAHGIPSRVGRLRAYGNAVIPEVAAVFVRSYREAVA